MACVTPSFFHNFPYLNSICCSIDRWHFIPVLGMVAFSSLLSSSVPQLGNKELALHSRHSPLNTHSITHSIHTSYTACRESHVADDVVVATVQVWNSKIFTTLVKQCSHGIFSSEKMSLNVILSYLPSSCPERLRKSLAICNSSSEILDILLKVNSWYAPWYTPTTLTSC